MLSAPKNSPDVIRRGASKEVVMSGPKQKMEVVLPREELSDFFKQLGEDVDSGALTLSGTDIDLSNFVELKVSVEPMGDQVMAKVKVKYPEALYIPQEGMTVGGVAAAAGVETGAKPKYKSLKKAMKKTWKHIVESVNAGARPQDEVVRTFYDQSLMMITYPGKGDDFYNAYEVAVNRMMSAYESEDHGELAEAVDAVGKLYKACHDRYK
jgi:XXXCH domain-containing protein